MARGIAVQSTVRAGVTDLAGTTAGGIDLTRTAGRTGRSLGLTPIRTPLPTPAAVSRMAWDSERFECQPVALGSATSGHAKWGRHGRLAFIYQVSVMSPCLSQGKSSRR